MKKSAIINNIIKNKVLFFPFILLFVLITGCAKPDILNISKNTSDIPQDTQGALQAADYCETAEDCAPNKCCHPDDTVNKEVAPDCETIFCDQSCQGPLDCGVGHIECNNNKCVIISN